jgi:hypothetical protein
MFENKLNRSLSFLVKCIQFVLAYFITGIFLNRWYVAILGMTLLHSARIVGFSIIYLLSLNW